MPTALIEVRCGEIAIEIDMMCIQPPLAGQAIGVGDGHKYNSAIRQKLWSGTQKLFETEQQRRPRRFAAMYRRDEKESRWSIAEDDGLDGPSFDGPADQHAIVVKWSRR